MVIILYVTKYICWNLHFFQNLMSLCFQHISVQNKNNMERNITGIYEITNFWCWYGFQPVRPQICLWFVFQPAGICLIQILVWFWFPASWKLLSGMPTSTAPPSSGWKSNSPPTSSKICLAETFRCQQKTCFEIYNNNHSFFSVFSKIFHSCQPWSKWKHKQAHPADSNGSASPKITKSA